MKKQITQSRKNYNKLYHREYRKNPVVFSYYMALENLSRILIRNKYLTRANEDEVMERFGCDVLMLCEQLGITSPEHIDEFRNSDLEINHIVPLWWFKQNPAYASYMNHYSNLELSPKSENRKNKKSPLNPLNDKQTSLINRMKRDQVFAALLQKEGVK